MTRQLFILAIVSLVTVPLAAQDDASSSDRADGGLEWNAGPRSGRPPLSAQLTDEPSPTDRDAIRAVEEIRFISNELQEAAPVPEVDPATPGAAQQSASCFYPAHDAGCGLGHRLDRCNCDSICFITDEWCDHSDQWTQGNCYLGENCWLCNDTWNDVTAPRMETYSSALRMGWWSMSNQGSPTKTGQYQDLKSSPFWDFDTLMSNGVRTLDMNLTGLSQESEAARARYYGPDLTANVRYQGFLRRYEHQPLYGFDLASGTPGPTNNVVTRDYNAGADYAIRVQMLDTQLHGMLTDNLKWTLNLWGMRKFGERQADAVGHCYNMTNTNVGTPNIRCHVISQQQNIDWLTMQMEPGLEAKYDNVSIQYTHLIRTFGQNDERVSRDYTRFGYGFVNGAGVPTNNLVGPQYIYGFTPENVTNIDRIKISADLNESNQVYATGFYGNTTNTFRDTTRQYSGVDLRWINRSIENVTLTGYGGYDQQNNDVPSVPFVTPPLGTPSRTTNPAQKEPGSLEPPIDYLFSRMGVRGSWQPFNSPFEDEGIRDMWSGLSLVSGYEYGVIARNNQWDLGSVQQPDTKMHLFELGPYWQWSRQLNSYIRYKGRFTEDPLTGVSGSGAVNTNQPTQDHRVELGGSWAPAQNLYATAQLSIVNAWNDSFYASTPSVTKPIHFTEQNYPVTTTLFWAPTDRLSLNGGYGYFSNWITQNINTSGPSQPEVTSQWNYSGYNQIVSFGINYNLTNDFQLIGGYEWDRGRNSFVNPPNSLVPPIDWAAGPGLSTYSAVLAETERYTAGFDWRVYRQTNVFARYNYFDYADLARNLYSGTTHMLLTGVTVVR